MKTPALKNLEEVNGAVRRIGELKRQVEETKIDLEEKIEGLKEKKAAQVKPLRKEFDLLCKQVYVFGKKHREEITKDGNKTIVLNSGSFGWRNTPPKVSILNLARALNALRRLGLDRFIRIIQEERIDKEALLKEPEIAESVDGLSITRGEDFVIAPNQIEIEIRAHHDSIKVR